jgi:hypothetical protein
VSLSLSLSQSLNPNWNLKHVHVAAAVVAAAAVPQVTKINILPGIIPTFGFLSISLLCAWCHVKFFSSFNTDPCKLKFSLRNVYLNIKILLSDVNNC